ncbi:MAG: WbqC family protein [Anaerolineae bacterium]|nr:WbqC family protein [Anaerolineae bacterium]
MEPDKFFKAGITCEDLQYNYPDYRQLYPPCGAHVSVLDLLLIAGKVSSRY